MSGPADRCDPVDRVDGDSVDSDGLPPVEESRDPGGARACPPRRCRSSIRARTLETGPCREEERVAGEGTGRRIISKDTNSGSSEVIPVALRIQRDIRIGKSIQMSVCMGSSGGRMR